MLPEFFSTPCLLFRPFDPSDLDGLAAIAADPDVMRHVGDGVTLDRATVALWIERSRENVARHGHGTGALVERATGRLVGWAGHARPEDGPPEIVYGLERAAWGRGYGREIAQGLVEHAFGTLGLPELRATVAPGNAASARILTGLGFVRVPWKHDEESHLYLLKPPALESKIENPKLKIERRLDELRDGRSPRLVARLESGWVELAPNGFRRGYCLLLADPVVPSLNDAAPEVQAAFLRDMARLGDAVRAATGAVRCNYGIYGNLDPFLHAHVVPRFLDEREDERTLPPLSLPPAVREDPATAFDADRDADLIEAIRRFL